MLQGFPCNTLALCPGTYGDLRGVDVSYEQGTPVGSRVYGFRTQEIGGYLEVGEGVGFELLVEKEHGLVAR